MISFELPRVHHHHIQVHPSAPPFSLLLQLPFSLWAAGRSMLPFPAVRAKDLNCGKPPEIKQLMLHEMFVTTDLPTVRNSVAIVPTKSTHRWGRSASYFRPWWSKLLGEGVDQILCSTCKRKTPNRPNLNTCRTLTVILPFVLPSNVHGCGSRPGYLG